jgi:hypothetical protein
MESGVATASVDATVETGVIVLASHTRLVPFTSSGGGSTGVGVVLTAVVSSLSPKQPDISTLLTAIVIAAIENNPLFCGDPHSVFIFDLIMTLITFYKNKHTLIY